jgi:hypothetical protein
LLRKLTCTVHGALSLLRLLVMVVLLLLLPPCTNGKVTVLSVVLTGMLAVVLGWGLALWGV